MYIDIHLQPSPTTEYRKATHLPSAPTHHIFDGMRMAGQSERAQGFPGLLIGEVEQPHQVLSGSLLRRELFSAVLAEGADPEPVVLLHLAARRFHLLGQQLQEGRLADAVRADDGDPGGHVHAEVALFDQGRRRVVVAEVDVCGR